MLRSFDYRHFQLWRIFSRSIEGPLRAAVSPTLALYSAEECGISWQEKTAFQRFSLRSIVSLSDGRHGSFACLSWEVDA